MSFLTMQSIVFTVQMDSRILPVILLVIAAAHAFQYTELVQHIDRHQEEYVEVRCLLRFLYDPLWTLTFCWLSFIFCSGFSHKNKMKFYKSEKYLWKFKFIHFTSIFGILVFKNISIQVHSKFILMFLENSSCILHLKSDYIHQSSTVHGF